jgi:hypothetical protein
MKLEKRQDFITAIQLLESRVSKLESMWTGFNITQAQHRRALCMAVDSLQSGLTEPPVKFSPELQKEWDRITERAHNEYKKRSIVQARKVDWSKGELPH